MTTSRIDLSGDWTLNHFPERENGISHPTGLAQAGLTTLLARVPGNVELNLERAGELPDLYTAPR